MRYDPSFVKKGGRGGFSNIEIFLFQKGSMEIIIRRLYV
jgi:hypothetical protein